MTTTNNEPVLDVTRHRALYGENGLSVEGLADLAAVPAPLIVAYEGCRRLPLFFEGLIRISSALQVPIEELIAPRLLKGIRLGTARRRAQREGGSDHERPIGFRCRSHDAS